MKKNFNVNINDVIFHFDEDAFQLLNRYLDRLRNHFSGNPGREEIISDIENRIAEMLLERTSNKGNVVSLQDMQSVISTMGEPADIGEEEPEAFEAENFQAYKRLFRDPSDKVLGGVCGGLAAYFNLDPLWLRIAFIILTMIGGSGILIYTILWITVPIARTTADKLRMRGQSVNISNIERSIKEEFSGIKDTFNAFRDKAKKKTSTVMD